MNCKNCIKNDCTLSRTDNELNNPCPKFTIPKSKCPFCKKHFDKVIAKKHFKNTKMDYECPNCNEYIDSERIAKIHV